MVELDIGIFGRNLDDRLAPDTAGFEDVGLVDAGQFLPAFLRSPETGVRDPAHFRLVVRHVVPPFAPTGTIAFALLAEIDVAIELAHDQQVDPPS